MAWNPVAASMRTVQLGERMLDVVTRRAVRSDGAVSSSMMDAVVNDEWTSLVTQIFWRFRRRMSEKNTSPGADAGREGDWIKTSFGIDLTELHWQH